jgi:Spy/CpxP family protein refolding chaperone
MTRNIAQRRGVRLPRLLVAAVALAGVVLLGTQACAQTATQGPERGDGRRGRAEQRLDPAQRIDRRVAFLTERLQLTDRQQADVRRVLTEQSNQMRTLFPQGRDFRRDGANRPDSAQRAELRNKMQAIRERTEQRIDAVLTDRQRTAYRELREAQRNERGRGGQWRDRGDTTRHRPGAGQSRVGAA